MSSQFFGIELQLAPSSLQTWTKQSSVVVHDVDAQDTHLGSGNECEHVPFGELQLININN